VYFNLLLMLAKPQPRISTGTTLYKLYNSVRYYRRIPGMQATRDISKFQEVDV